jgi:hypothetical protein
MRERNGPTALGGRGGLTARAPPEVHQACTYARQPRGLAVLGWGDSSRHRALRAVEGHGPRHLPDPRRAAGS